MRQVKLALVLLGVATVAACGRGGAGALTREASAALDETRSESRTFRYVDATLDGKRTVIVDGKVQDDLRYSGTVSMNEKKIYQMIVSDDSVAVRFLSAAATKRAVAVAEKADPITARVLREGGWVVDHTVAPPLLAAAAARDEEVTADRPTTGLRRQNLIGDDPVVDGSQLLNYSERAVRSGFGVERFNAEAVGYNALDDPWAADGTRDLDDEGLVRYDLLQPALPSRAERGKAQTLPTLEHFRKMALYAKGEHVVEIRERISLSERREFRRAETGRAARYYLTLRDTALKGALQDELRQRDMRYTITKLGNVEVSLPPNAVEGILGDVLPVLKSIFGFEYIGGSGPTVTPGESPAPGGSPASTDEPGATTSPATAAPSSPAA
jgi:hypothetical protein